MISSRFRYASVHVGFGSAGAASYKAWQAENSRVSSAITTAATGSSSDSPFDSALQDKITGAATLAAQAGIARVQAAANAKSTEITDQIDSAQSALVNSNTTAGGSGVIIVGDTVIQKNYVSWAYSPPTTATSTTDTTA
jgi:hypothetical protein